MVVLGATGHFGSRICRRLLCEAGLRLVIAGRSETRLLALAESLSGAKPAADIVQAVIDQDSAWLAHDLGRFAPDIVLHTAGPYQGREPSVARACLETGSRYLDLADGREFVSNFSELDEAALARNVLLVSGASTLPGVSSAVLEHCRGRFASIRAIATCIAPAHRTPRGAGTVAAVLSYCGRPFRVLENGRWRSRYGWQDLCVRRFPALGRRLAAACDVPDLALFPDAFPDLETATFHAALEAPCEHVTLWLMAALRRARLVRDWRRFAPTLQRAAWLLEQLGSEDSGMSVAIDGTGFDGRPRRVVFQLTARRRSRSRNSLHPCARAGAQAPAQ